MCNTCGQNTCNCNCNSSNSTYNYNWFNTDGLPCTDCDPVVVCQRKIYSLCVKYNGPNLTNLGINTNDSLNDILLKLDNIKQTQDLLNAKLLANINDLNTRLNTLAGGTPHDPYTSL